MLHISEDQVRELLNWDDTYDAVKTALESVSRKQVVQNARSSTNWQPNSRLLTMPSYLSNPKFGALSCKLVTIYPNNEKLENPLSVINATIILFDEETGHLKAVLDANEITNWRTAAASVIATKYLTSNKSTEILAVLGAGAQGNIHAFAFLHFFNFTEIRIWNRTISKAELLVSELSQTCPNKTFKSYYSIEECVKDADVIITATFSQEPIVNYEWLKRGVHINVVGVTGSLQDEISNSIYANSENYVDYMEGAEAELGHLLEKGVTFQEIGSLVTGDLQEPENDKITVFRSLGMAVEDGVMARLVYDLYVNKNK